MNRNVISAILALALIVSGILTVSGNSTYTSDICGTSVWAKNVEQESAEKEDTEEEIAQETVQKAGSAVHTVWTF